MTAPEVLVVDAANVVGSRPNGWWRDRPKAAADFCKELSDALEAGRLASPVVVVIEGVARKGVPEGERDGLRVVHAPHEGDDAIVDVATVETAEGHTVTVVTADRELRERVAAAGANTVGPRWLLDRLSSDGISR